MKKLIIGFIFAFLGIFTFAGTAFAGTVYNAVPNPLPPNTPSQPFQAQQTFEFGDYVHLGGTDRILTTITFSMSTWARHSDWPSYIGDTWTHPITVNVYSNHLNSGVPDTLLATKEVNISIPWRPESDPTCPDTGYGVGFAWRAGDGKCYNGLAFNATFDLSDLHAILPNDVIVSVAYNTETWGKNPLGVDGPYDSLNVLVPPNDPVTVGSDDSNTEVYWNTATCSYYADGGTNGCNVLRKDWNWLYLGDPVGTVAIKIDAISLHESLKYQCFDNGWKTFTNPKFKNQGECVSYFANGKTLTEFLAPDSLYYNGPTASAPLYANGAIGFAWDKNSNLVMGGYYNEIAPPYTGTAYYNVVTGGTVTGGNHFDLNFSRSVPNSYSFVASLDLSGNLLSGLLDGDWITATGN